MDIISKKGVTRLTYLEFCAAYLNQQKPGVPIYTRKIAEKMADTLGLAQKTASAATAVAIKRILARGLVPNLRFYQKGIYYLTTHTAFGELGINKEQLIFDKYLAFDIGYETDLSFLHRMGLTTQIPRERIIATNAAKDGTRRDERLDVTIRPPKTQILTGNRAYLQILDAMECMGRAPVDAVRPHKVFADYIRENGLDYEKLLYFADRYYGRNTVLQLAHTAGEEDMIL